MNVLLAVSDRFFGDALVNFASQHSWEADAHFRFIKVILPPEKQPGSNHDDREIFFEEDLREAKELLEKLSRMLRAAKRGCKVSCEVLVGSPGNRLVEYATNWPADMIIMGAREQSNFERLLLGSVSKYLTEHAPCSFCVVRIPHDEALDLDLSEKELLEELEIPVG